jgi:hypothetical protein
MSSTFSLLVAVNSSIKLSWSSARKRNGLSNPVMRNGCANPAPEVEPNHATRTTRLLTTTAARIGLFKKLRRNTGTTPDVF